MNGTHNRRGLLRALGIGCGMAALPLPAATSPRKLRIGHTCITWGAFPRAGAETTIEPALKDISATGFWSFETFPELLEALDQQGALSALMDKYKVPLRSGYITGNLIDPSKRKDEVQRISRLAKVVQKYKGTFIVLAPEG